MLRSLVDDTSSPVERAVFLVEMIVSLLPVWNESVRPLQCCRRHVQHEIDWLAPAALLDQFGSSGWAMIAGLVSGQRTAADLLASNLFLDLRED